MTEDKTKQKSKEKVKNMFKGIGAALAVIIFCCLFFFAVCNALEKFKLIDTKQWLTISVVCGLCCAAILIAYGIYVVKKHCDVKSFFWLRENVVTLVLAIIIIMIACVSLTPEPIWSKEDIKDVISIQWVIFGISVTIFLVWQVFVKDHLNKRSGNNSGDEKQDYRKQYQSRAEGIALIVEANDFVTTAILLAINVSFLVGSTVAAYLINDPENIHVQNMLIFCFYLCTNSLTKLFFDILCPIFKVRKAVRDENKISKDQLDELEIKAGIEQELEDQINKITDNALMDENAKREVFDDLKEIVDLLYYRLIKFKSREFEIGKFHGEALQQTDENTENKEEINITENTEDDN